MQKRKEKEGLHLQRERKSKKCKKGKEMAWKGAEKKKERQFPVSGLKKREKRGKRKSMENSFAAPLFLAEAVFRHIRKEAKK